MSSKNNSIDSVDNVIFEKDSYVRDTRDGWIGRVSNGNIDEYGLIKVVWIMTSSEMFFRFSEYSVCCTYLEKIEKNLDALIFDFLVELHQREI